MVIVKFLIPGERLAVVLAPHVDDARQMFRTWAANARVEATWLDRPDLQVTVLGLDVATVVASAGVDR